MEHTCNGLYVSTCDACNMEKWEQENQSDYYDPYYEQPEWDVIGRL